MVAINTLAASVNIRKRTYGSLQSARIRLIACENKRNEAAEQYENSRQKTIPCTDR